MKKIGLSISEGQLASPLKTLQVSSLEDALSQIQQILITEKIDQIILGKPEGEMGKIVDGVVKKMEQRDWELVIVDETLSTQRAQQGMIEQSMSQKERRDDNAMAASLILQQYLDEKR